MGIGMFRVMNHGLGLIHDRLQLINWFVSIPGGGDHTVRNHICFLGSWECDFNPPLPPRWWSLPP